MPYVSGFDRDQLMCCSWDAFVDEESIARIIDAFVEHLDIKKLGVEVWKKCWIRRKQGILSEIRREIWYTVRQERS